MKDLTLKIQTEVMGKGTGLKAITDREAPSPKAPLVKKGNMKQRKETKTVKDKAGSVMKRPAARTSTCSSTRSESDDSLTYRPVKDSCEPRYYGEVTIYTDIIQNLWRIKPGRARRDHKKIVFGDKPREQWKKVVKWVKEL